MVFEFRVTPEFSKLSDASTIPGVLEYNDGEYVYKPPAKASEREIQPLSDENVVVKADRSSENLRWCRLWGLKAIAHNTVAVLVLCGGQATRLEADRPKGTFDLELPTPFSTLLDHQAGQIVRLKTLANQATGMKSKLTWYVMVSKSTRAAITEHLDGIRKRLDIPEDEVVIFEQDEIPAFDFNGKKFLQPDGSFFTAPNGNGGIYESMKPLLPNLESKGIQLVHVYCVDNILCRVGDPIFIGTALARNADCGAKVVQKKQIDEKVGVCCLVNGNPAVVEYTELPEELASKKTGEKLLYRAVSIGDYLFSLEFLKRVCNVNLPYHIARKKIPFADENKELQKPNDVYGVKLERNSFDVFPYSKKFFVYEVEREDEFSPLKNSNAARQDCPDTCRQNLTDLHKRWLEKAGVDLWLCPTYLISPLSSYDGENLTADAVRKACRTNPGAGWIQVPPHNSSVEVMRQETRTESTQRWWRKLRALKASLMGYTSFAFMGGAYLVYDKTLSWNQQYGIFYGSIGLSGFFFLMALAVIFTKQIRSRTRSIPSAFA